MRTKKIVAVDMDDTILYLLKAMHRDHQQCFPDFPLSYSDMVAFDESMLHPDYRKMDFFNRPGTFESLELIDEHVVTELAKINEDYDLLIVTSAYPESVVGKWKWLQEHLPFIPHANFCCMSRKDLLQADLLIDDAIHNVRAWTNKGLPALVPEHHWNQELRELDGVTMFRSWAGLKDEVDRLLVSAEEALMLWLDYQLRDCSPAEFKVHAVHFADMWRDEFGDHHPVPDWYKQQITERLMALVQTQLEASLAL